MSTNPTAGQPADLREQAAQGARLLLLDSMRATNSPNVQAAVDLLGATSVLDQAAGWQQVAPDGRVDWPGLHGVIARGDVVLTDAEWRMARLACSLASPYTQVSLAACLSGLDDVQAGAVLAAVRHALEGGAR